MARRHRFNVSAMKSELPTAARPPGEEKLAFKPWEASAYPHTPVPAAVDTEPVAVVRRRSLQLGGASAKYSVAPLAASASPVTAPSCAMPAAPSTHPATPVPAAVATAPPASVRILLFPGSEM